MTPMAATTDAIAPNPSGGGPISRSDADYALSVPSDCRRIGGECRVLQGPGAVRSTSGVVGAATTQLGGSLYRRGFGVVGFVAERTLGCLPGG
jgi:hypothetical protein